MGLLEVVFKMDLCSQDSNTNGLFEYAGGVRGSEYSGFQQREKENVCELMCIVSLSPHHIHKVCIDFVPPVLRRS